METHTVITEKSERASYTDLFLRTIAVIGLVAVLILGAWGIIQLAIAIPNLFGSIGSGTVNTNAQKESLTVSSPASLTSGQTLQLVWSQKNADTSQYSYAVSYACQSGLSVAAPVPTGAYQPVPCNTLFNYVTASAHMTLIPTVSGTSLGTASIPLVLTVTATKLSTGAITSSGTSTTMVAPAAPTTTTKPVTTTTKPATTKPAASTYYPASTRAALFGYADLATSIVSVTPNGTRTTVQFIVANVGTNIVNSGWTFNASLPINGSYTFASQAQQALYPGDKIVYNLVFDNTYGTNQYQQYGTSGYTSSGYTCNGYNCTNTNQYGYPVGNTGYPYTNGYSLGTVTITADPLNYIVEANKGNNSASVSTPIY